MLGQEPPPPPIDPLCLSKPGYVRGLLTDAGFDGDSVTERTDDSTTYPFNLGQEDFAFKCVTMVVSAKLKVSVYTCVCMLVCMCVYVTMVVSAKLQVSGIFLSL